MKNNNITLLLSILHACKMNMLSDIFIFGGWAEQFWRLAEPREHNDIDFLICSNNLNRLDTLINNKKYWLEISDKHFPHKRAVTVNDVMIEFTLVGKNGNIFFTDYFSNYKYLWPEDTFSYTISIQDIEANIASKKSLIDYRKNHHLIVDSYNKYRNQYLNK